MVVDEPAEEPSIPVREEEDLEDPEDEEEGNSSDISMVPMADMLNARFGSENVLQDLPPTFLF